MERLDAKGVSFVRVTLHVGAGTFLPVKVEDTRDHVMHAEFGVVSEDAATRINAARAAEIGLSVLARPPCGYWNPLAIRKARFTHSAPRRPFS